MNKHFEKLWEEAEGLSAKNPLTKDELFIRIGDNFQDYAKLDNIPSKEIQSILKTKKLGEILFKIAELSRVDGINTFAALQLEMQCVEKSNQS